jgi:hypothetical protein
VACEFELCSSVLLTCDPEISRDVALLFNQLTGALPLQGYQKLIVAPREMRTRFTELIRREAEHARCGRTARIRAKVNQLQDPDIIRELYKANQAGVSIDLNVRGLAVCARGLWDSPKTSGSLASSAASSSTAGSMNSRTAASRSTSLVPLTG